MWELNFWYGFASGIVFIIVLALVVTKRKGAALFSKSIDFQNQYQEKRLTYLKKQHAKGRSKSNTK